MSQLSLLDQLITGADQVLRTLASSHTSSRKNPGASIDEAPLSHQEKRHSAGLMRINHTGEVCAQGLYQGQALTAKSAHIKAEMQQSSAEEADHLQWCGQRLGELNSRPSLLNGLFYGASFGMGAVAGTLGDKVSLGFVAATEEQVCAHLEKHLHQLPAHDNKSRAIVAEMIIDENKHENKAMSLGGKQLPGPVKWAMKGLSKVMTSTTYYL